jgi:ferredoxin
VRYTVDTALCAGHGLCFRSAPGVFTPDDDGFNSDVGRTVEVGDTHLSDVQNAARTCPEQAIRVLTGAPVP